MKVVAVLYPGGNAAWENPDLLGCAEHGLGLRDVLGRLGHNFLSTSEREAGLQKEISDADVLITTPFWPVYVTRERLEQAPNLKLLLTAGVGSDHIDLMAAAERGITVAEITGSNVVSVAEHAVMQILVAVRNFIPAYKQVIEGGWDIAAISAHAHDLESKTVGLLGLGRIGQRIALRLKPFEVKLLYHDFRRPSSVEEAFLGVSYVSLDELLERSDVVSISCPLTPKTDGMFNKNRLLAMKKGAYLINTARGRIVETEALVEVLRKGHLAGYAGDVWYPQPAPSDHPWRHMPCHAMTPHVSGTTLEAQKRYAQGVKECLLAFFQGESLPSDYLIVDGGRVVSPSYSYAYRS